MDVWKAKRKRASHERMACLLKRLLNIYFYED